MYIWKISPLIDELKTQNLSQKEQFKYFLTYSLFMVLSTEPSLYADFNYVFYDTIDTFVASLITVLGIVYCYKINEKGDGKDFILRFITLGIPISVRFGLVMIVVIGFYYGFIDSSDLEVIATEPTDVVLSTILFSGYYYYFGSKFKAIGQP
jgi:hypothetical protein